VNYKLIETNQEHLSYFKNKEGVLNLGEYASFGLSEETKSFSTSTIKNIKKEDSFISIETIDSNLFKFKEIV
jgi:hypothetical protein